MVWGVRFNHKQVKRYAPAQVMPACHHGRIGDHDAGYTTITDCNHDELNNINNLTDARLANCLP